MARAATRPVIDDDGGTIGWLSVELRSSIYGLGDFLSLQRHFCSIACASERLAAL